MGGRQIRSGRGMVPCRHAPQAASGGAPSIHTGPVQRRLSKQPSQPTRRTLQLLSLLVLRLLTTEGKQSTIRTISPARRRVATVHHTTIPSNQAPWSLLEFKGDNAMHSCCSSRDRADATTHRSRITRRRCLIHCDVNSSIEDTRIRKCGARNPNSLPLGPEKGVPCMIVALRLVQSLLRLQ